MRQSHILSTSRLHKKYLCEHRGQYSDFSFAVFPNCLLDQSGMHPAAATLLQTDPSQFPVDDSSSDLGEPLLT